MAHFTSPRALLTRREALRRGSLMFGSAFLGASFLPKLIAQTAPSAANAPSVDTPDHPIAQMRRSLGEAPLETIRLTDRHFALTGNGGNIGVYVGDEAMLLVDSGSGRPPATEKLRSALRALSDRPVRYLVNTHWHFDHTDGNVNVHGLGASIVGHRNVRTRLGSPQINAFFNAAFPAAGIDALPTVTFDQALDLYVGTEAVLLQHVPPAHTDSDSIVHWPKSNVIHTGDLLFAGTFPFIDGSSGGSLEGMIAAEEKIFSLADTSTHIIPGHGPVAGKDDVKASVDMLRTVKERLDRLKSAGKSVDEAVAAKPLADLDAKWGGGMFNADSFVRIVYSLPKHT